MQITGLGGHSGCQILLCETDDKNNKVFVRKVSSSKEYNERLIIQAEKQRKFSFPNIKSPSVINDGYTSAGLYFFDMDYIQGITLAEYMKYIRIVDIRRIVETIVSEIVQYSEINPVNEQKAFVDKIKSLKVKLQGKNEIIDESLELLSAHSWKNFVSTNCHGDLTLENIIVKDNQLYFIDFLDSFYDSWILDISTLMQDVQTLWAYRNDDEININTVLRLMVFRDILMNTVKKISPDNYLEVYYALLLKLLRIFPYTKDKQTFSFLVKKTKSIVEIINREETNENTNSSLCRPKND